MGKMKKYSVFDRVIQFTKKETVLVLAAILALISVVFVPPGPEYAEYIDCRVLGILLSLMIVTTGLLKNGFFDIMGNRLLAGTKNTAQLTGVLVFICFFSSMIITNDVALVTFVPFAMLTLQRCGQERLIMLVLVLQTIAANLGSMLTPIGNPQNLYLYNLSGMGAWEFILYMLPYTGIAGVLLSLVIFVLSARKQKISIQDCVIHDVNKVNMKKNTVYMGLFGVCMLIVARILPYQMVLAAVLIIVFFMDRAVLGSVDYCLLFTFISFFIFTGNIGNIPAVKDMLQNLVDGKELWISILASQFISNVPAALLLAEFTEDYKKLLIGVNIGGLGTLIASMASLISYKVYAHNYNRTKGIYLIWFTIANLLFLAVFLVVATGFPSA